MMYVDDPVILGKTCVDCYFYADSYCSNWDIFTPKKLPASILSIGRKKNELVLLYCLGVHVYRRYIRYLGDWLYDTTITYACTSMYQSGG